MSTPIDPATRGTARTRNRGWYILLLAPFVAVLWMPLYAKPTPTLFGFPFFYWWQFLWVIISVVITVIVYLLTTGSDAPRPGEAPGPPGAGTGWGGQ